jgi:hypothetical protein
MMEAMNVCELTETYLRPNYFTLGLDLVYARAILRLSCMFYACQPIKPQSS